VLWHLLIRNVFCVILLGYCSKFSRLASISPVISLAAQNLSPYTSWLYVCHLQGSLNPTAIIEFSILELLIALHASTIQVWITTLPRGRNPRKWFIYRRSFRLHISGRWFGRIFNSIKRVSIYACNQQQFDWSLHQHWWFRQRKHLSQDKRNCQHVLIWCSLPIQNGRFPRLYICCI